MSVILTFKGNGTYLKYLPEDAAEDNSKGLNRGAYNGRDVLAKLVLVGQVVLRCSAGELV